MGATCCGGNGPGEQESEVGPGWSRPDMANSTFRQNLCASHRGRDVRDDYAMDNDSLGMTGYDYVSVRTVRSKANRKAYACKTFRFGNQDRKERADNMASLRTEVQLLSSLDHPNIIRPFATYEDFANNELHIIMELCSGGDLNARQYTEREAARILYKILNAVNYCHSHGIVHRDIKTENILFESAEADAEVKLIDFGMSRRFIAGDWMHEQIGTVYTVAPEVLEGTYTEKCDMWSIGVVAFIMLSGESPFEGGTEQETVDNLCAARYRWPADCPVSADAREFVYSLLKVDPDRRWSSTRALISPFLKKLVHEAAPESPLSRRPSFGVRMINTLRRYERAKGLKKLALMITAYTFDPSMVADLRRTFIAMDKKGTGEISKEQLRRALRVVFKRAMDNGLEKEVIAPDAGIESKVSEDATSPLAPLESEGSLGMSDTEFEALFRAMDVDRRGVISYVEFLGATIEMCGSFTQDRLCEVFNKLDVDNSGAITIQNLREILGSDAENHELETMVAEADLNGSSTIGLSEFLRLMGVKESEIIEQEKKQIENLRTTAAGADALEELQHEKNMLLEEAALEAPSEGAPMTPQRL